MTFCLFTYPQYPTHNDCTILYFYHLNTNISISQYPLPANFFSDFLVVIVLYKMGSSDCDF